MFTNIIMGIFGMYVIAILASISKDIKKIQERLSLLERGNDDTS